MKSHKEGVCHNRSVHYGSCSETWNHMAILNLQNCWKYSTWEGVSFYFNELPCTGHSLKWQYHWQLGMLCTPVKQLLFQVVKDIIDFEHRKEHLQSLCTICEETLCYRYESCWILATLNCLFSQSGEKAP